MSRTRFAATRLTPAQAHEVWGRSDQASAFTRPDYLARLVDEVDWWGVERSGEVVAAWPLVRTVAGGEIEPPPFCYYVGPMFARELRAGRHYSRYWPAYAEAFSNLIDAIVAEHRRFRSSLPPGLTDVRALQWWNFDHPEQNGFATTPRFTARIDLSTFSDLTELRRSFASTRKRDIDRWTSTPPDLVEDVGPVRLIELHDQALERTGGVADQFRRNALRRSIELVASGAGSIIGLVPQGQTQVEAAIILLDGASVSNSVFYAASDDWRNQGLTAWAVWQGLLRARERGLRWLDFNGANSPRRAADKHYYSAKPELYFDCSFGICDRLSP